MLRLPRKPHHCFRRVTEAAFAGGSNPYLGLIDGSPYFSTGASSSAHVEYVPDERPPRTMPPIVPAPGPKARCGPRLS